MTLSLLPTSSLSPLRFVIHMYVLSNSHPHSWSNLLTTSLGLTQLHLHVIRLDLSFLLGCQGIRENVASPKDAVLYLWNVHNKLVEIDKLDTGCSRKILLSSLFVLCIFLADWAHLFLVVFFLVLMSRAEYMWGKSSLKKASQEIYFSYFVQKKRNILIILFYYYVNYLLFYAYTYTYKHSQIY